jgi:hypothetical protein
VLTLSCPNIADLRDRQGWQLRNLGHAIKSALKTTPNCDFKPCGYKLDSGSDLTPIDDNSFEFPIQGSAVRSSRSEMMASGLVSSRSPLTCFPTMWSLFR